MSAPVLTEKTGLPPTVFVIKESFHLEIKRAASFSVRTELQEQLIVQPEGVAFAPAKLGALAGDVLIEEK